jgi:subtilisin family serine protease
MKYLRTLMPSLGLVALLMGGCTKSDTALQERQAAAEAAGNTVANASASDNPGGRPIKDAYIVVFKDDVADVNAAVDEMTKPVNAKAKYVYRHTIKGFAVSLPAVAIENMRKNPKVRYIEQDQEVSVNVTQTGATWGIDRTDQTTLPLDGGYTYESTGSSVDAYIFDTGIKQDHTEFGGRAKPGYDAFVAGGPANDLNGHGTHVAGTVGGTRYGMAKNVTLYAVKVLGDNGSGSWSGVIAGIDWAVGHHTTRPAVGNMSLGGGASTSVDDAVRRAVADGIVMCVAAGNSTADASTSSPARTAEAITVGATTSSDGFASYSNFGSVVDILAPGSSITSAWYTSTTAINTISGTSMASPHVAGASVLYLEANPGSTPAQVSTGLKAIATPNRIGSVPAGTANLLLYVKFGTPPPPQPPAAPVLSSPANGATNISTSPTLSWAASTGAVSYGVQVSTAPDFSTTVTNTSVTGTSITLSGLANGTTYYWRVNATNSVGTSAWSTTRSFTTAPLASLLAPVLSSPATGATNVAVNPTLVWNAASGATAYDVQVSTKSNFSSLVVNQTGVSGTSLALSGLRRNVNHYWRVRSRNSTAVSAWSTAWSFKTVR